MQTLRTTLSVMCLFHFDSDLRKILYSCPDELDGIRERKINPTELA